MTRIYCVGEVLVDIIGEENASLKSNQKFTKHPGGAPANVAVAASRMGADVHMVSTVGDDEFGEFLIEKLEEEDINTSWIRKTDLDTTLAFASLDQESKPHFKFYRGADEKISREQLEIQPGKDDIVHLGSLPLTDPSTARNIVRLIEQTEAAVSFDPNIREDILDEAYMHRLEKVVKRADIMILADDELQYFEEIDLGEHLSELIVTKGSQGAQLYGDENISVEAPEVNVVDTTGAGDALAGAFLAFRDQGPRKALEKAVKAASLSTTSEGAIPSLPYKRGLTNKSLLEVN
ncbi:MAG: fructokinase [Candidatus Nanohaloarchaea archaeon]|jgi:fructokinase